MNFLEQLIINSFPEQQKNIFEACDSLDKIIKTLKQQKACVMQQEVIEFAKEYKEFQDQCNKIHPQNWQYAQLCFLVVYNTNGVL